MINPKYTTGSSQDHAIPPINGDRFTILDAQSREAYQNIAAELEESAQSLLDWHPLPEDEQYTRVAAVRTTRATYKLAERQNGLAVWTIADDQPPQLVMSTDPNRHIKVLDPELAKDATQTFRAAAIAETMGIYLRSTQLKEWISPSESYLIQGDFNPAGEVSTLQVNTKTDDGYEPILVVQDNQILLNHLTQDDLEKFRRFGKHMRSQLLQQQYVTTTVQFSEQPVIPNKSQLDLDR